MRRCQATCRLLYRLRCMIQHAIPMGRDQRFASVALRAPLAQLAEQLTLNQRVGGSIPSRRTDYLVRRIPNVLRLTRKKAIPIKPPPNVTATCVVLRASEGAGGGIGRRDSVPLPSA